MGREQWRAPPLVEFGAGGLVGHARRCPRTEIDADPRNTPLTQPPSQPVEEGVRRAVSGLAASAPYPGNRRGAEEEVQLQIGGSLCLNPSTPDPTRVTPGHIR